MAATATGMVRERPPHQRPSSLREFPAGRWRVRAGLLCGFGWAALLALCPATLGAQSAPTRTPATAASAPESAIPVTVSEGTNLAAALSPDGHTLALDLLGRIWVLPAGGGTARALTDPDGDARQPAWSPDGGRIAFQAYWDGNYQIWSIAADGTDLRRHTRGPWDHREPHWSPDGSRIAFSADRAGSYDIWMVAVAGTGGADPEQVTAAPGSEYGPAFSPSGAALAYAAGGAREVAEIRIVAVPDRGAKMESRSPVTLVRAHGDEADARLNAPAWSAAGDRLIFNVLAEGRSALRSVAVADPDSERAPPPLSAASLLTDPTEDVFPFRASATAGAVLYTADGRIRHRTAADGAPRDIPFAATVHLDRSPYTRRTRDLEAPGPHMARGIVSPAVSPDGTRVAFAALGDLWIHAIGGATRRITDDPWIETDPAWSPDGSRLVFVSDRDAPARAADPSGTASDSPALLDLYLLDPATGAIERLTEGAGATLPSWSPDGSRLAFVGSGYQVGVRVLELATRSARTLRAGLNGAGRPSWSPAGDAVVVSAHWPYSERFREGINRAMVLAVTPPQPVMCEPQEAPPPRFLDLPGLSIGTRGTDGPVRSPNGAWMAYIAEGVLWAAPVDAGGNAVGSARRLTNDAAADPTWTGDSRSIVHLSGSRLRRVNLVDGAIEEIPLELRWERAPESPSLLIRAGAIWDGVTDSLRADVDLLIRGGRIVEVAARDRSRTAEGIVDATDAVVMPGLIDMHAHGGITGGEQAGRIWLAYGVTSVRCPACDPYESAEEREAVGAGRRIGPRWFGTGGTIDGSRIYYPGAPALGGAAQLDLELENARTLGYDLIKTYVRLPDPVQRRVVREAHALGLPVTSHELYPAVAFGADGVEHVRGTSRRGYSTKISELQRSYADVVELLAASGMTLTPTIGIYGAYGLLAADDPSLFDDPRIQAFFPWAPLSARPPAELAVARRLARDMASLPRRVLEAGGRVIVGTDAPINPPGLSFQAELEAMVRYGEMAPVDVLRAATSVPGGALGHEGRLGVIAPGALADLIVVGADPLADIRAIRDLRMVVRGGRLHEAGSLRRR